MKDEFNIFINKKKKKLKKKMWDFMNLGRRPNANMSMETEWCVLAE